MKGADNFLLPSRVGDIPFIVRPRWVWIELERQSVLELNYPKLEMLS